MYLSRFYTFCRFRFDDESSFKLLAISLGVKFKPSSLQRVTMYDSNVAPALFYRKIQYSKLIGYLINDHVIKILTHKSPIHFGCTGHSCRKSIECLSWLLRWLCSGRYSVWIWSLLSPWDFWLLCDSRVLRVDWPVAGKAKHFHFCSHHRATCEWLHCPTIDHHWHGYVLYCSNDDSWAVMIRSFVWTIVALRYHLISASLLISHHHFPIFRL